MERDEINSLLERLLSLPDGENAAPDDIEQLLELSRCFPHAVLPAVLLLRHGCPDSDTEAMRERTALLSSDPRTIAFAAYGDSWAHFYPPQEEPERMRTLDVIDTFLNTYGSCTPEEEALLERMIFNPAPDYGEMLAREEQESLPAPDDAPKGSQDELINSFIRSRHPATHRPELMPDPQREPASEPEAKTPVAHPDHTDDSLLSESLAKIFIKRGRYEKAYEIISGLNLKFPKKSAYFADQLRFLHKLIINQRRLDELAAASGASEK